MLVLRYIRQGDGFRLLVRLQGLGAAVLGESEGVFEVFGRELTFGVLIGGHLLLHAGAFTQILHLDFVLQVVHLRPRSLYFLLRILLDRVHLPDIELQPVPIFLAIAPLPRKSTGPPFADALLGGEAQLPLVDVSEPADPFFVVAPQICELLLVGSLNLFYLFTHVGPICFALEVVVSLQDETAAAVGQEAPHRKLRLPPIICFPSLPAVNGGEGHFEFVRQTMIFFSEQFDSVVFG